MSDEIGLKDYSLKETTDRGTVIVLRRDVEFILDGKVYVMPAGVESDGFSCPRWAQRIVAPQFDKRTLSSAVKHDFIYMTHICSRLYADWIFMCDLIDRGFPVLKAILTFIGVRFGGWFHW